MQVEQLKVPDCMGRVLPIPGKYKVRLLMLIGVSSPPYFDTVSMTKKKNMSKIDNNIMANCAKSADYKQKSFIKFDSWGLYYKSFYGKSVNYGRKKSYSTGPRSPWQCIQ